MYRKDKRTIVNGDVMFPIVETGRSRHRSNNHSFHQKGCLAALWSVSVTYIVWPLAHLAMKFLWKIALFGVVLCFFFGMSPSDLWLFATWFWGMASYGNATNWAEAARSILHGR